MHDAQRDDLLAELRRYRPVDLTERGHLLRFLELLHLDATVADRSHFAPGHLTASAFIVDPGARRLLLHHHRRLDRWLQMGGHVEPGEWIHDAARREAQEESGLSSLELAVDTIFDLDVHVIPAAKGEPEHSHYDVRYLLVAGSSDSLQFDTAESLDLRWFDFPSAVRLMNEDGSSRVIRKIEAFLDGTIV